MNKKTIFTLFTTTALIALSLILSACGPKEPVTVEVTLTEFGIESSVSEFKSGTPYHFVITNEGAINHEFMIMEPTAEGMMMSMEEMDEMALAFVEEDELTPGASQTLDYTFTEPASAGSLEIACHTSGHYEAGMKFPITVE